MKWILIYFEGYEQYVFFNRFRKNLKILGYDFFVVTQKPSLYAICTLRRYRCKFVFKRNSQAYVELPLYLSGLVRNILSPQEIRTYFNSVTSVLEKIVDKFKPECAFIYNGLQITALALDIISLKNNMNTLYFELSNLPGKVFVSPGGVNAASILYNNPAILNNFNSTEEEFEEWKNLYFNQKRKEINCNVKLKQSLLFFLDFILLKILNVPKSGEYNLFNKLYEKIISAQSVYKYDKIDIKKCQYIFFPLQVNNDTQLLVNSDIDNIRALEIAAEVAKNEKCNLVVKPHPKETDVSAAKDIMLLKEKHNFFLVNLPVRDVIENAKKVISINSTVGLEAMIMNKEVHFLGRTFYSELNGPYLRNFIIKFLINIDYGDCTEVDIETIQEIIKRCNMR